MKKLPHNEFLEKYTLQGIKASVANRKRSENIAMRRLRIAERLRTYKVKL